MRRNFIRLNRQTQQFEVDDRKINPASLLSTRWLLHALEPTRAYANGRLLDIGCGTKPYKAFYHVQQHVGVDWLSSAHHLEIEAFADAQTLPFADSSFDTVLCTEVIEHLPRPWMAIEEMARVLKPGGCLILTAPFVHVLHEQPRDHYTSYGLLSLVRQFHLEPVAVWQRGGPFGVVFDQGTRLMATWLRAAMRRLHFSKAIQDSVLRIVITPPQRLVAFLTIDLSRRSRSTAPNLLPAPSQLAFGYVLVARRMADEEIA